MSKYGNGSGGALNVTSGTYNLALNTHHQFTSVNVASGAVLSTSSTTGSVLYISATESIIIDGSINVSNKLVNGQGNWPITINGVTYNTPGVSSGGAGGWFSGNTQGQQYLGHGGGGAGNYAGTIGGNGATATGSDPDGGNSATATRTSNGTSTVRNNATHGGGGSGEGYAYIANLAGGAAATVRGIGGAGGETWGANGSNGSTSYTWNNTGSLNYSMYGGGGGGAGGRAGKSGVHVVLRAPTIIINGTIVTSGTAGQKGGNGGRARSNFDWSNYYGLGGGGGGGGDGGNITILHGGTYTAGTYTLSAGAGGGGGIGGLNQGSTAGGGDSGDPGSTSIIESKPTISLNTPTNGSTPGTQTPALTFTGTEPEGYQLTYQIQVSTDNTFTEIEIDAQSNVDAGFSGTDPYNSATQVSFTPQEPLPEGGSTYYWRVRARDPLSTASWGDWSTTYSFENIDTPPIVSSVESAGVSSSAATLSGMVIADGGTSITERGFVYSLSDDPTTADNKAVVSGTIGTYNTEITGLSSYTQYYWRAYAINSLGTSYGITMSFTTPATSPTVTTGSIINLEHDSLTISGSEVTSNPDSIDFQEYGIVYSTSPTPTILDSSKAGILAGSTFDVDVSDLNENTTYYIRAYVKWDNVNYVYGNEISQLTPLRPKPELAGSVSTSSHTTSMSVNMAPTGQSFLVAFISVRSFTQDVITITDSEDLDWTLEYEFAGQITSVIAYAKLPTNPVSLDINFSWTTGKGAVVVQEWSNVHGIARRARNPVDSGNTLSGSASITLGEPYESVLVSALFNTGNFQDGIQDNPSWLYVNGAETGGLSTQKTAVATFSLSNPTFGANLFSWTSGYTQLGETAIIELVAEGLPIEKLKDDFTIYNDDKWYYPEGVPSLATKRLMLTEGNPAFTFRNYLLQDGESVHGKFSGLATADGAGMELSYVNGDYAYFYMGMYSSTQEFLFSKRVNNVTTDIEITSGSYDNFDFNDYLWWRIRRDGNDICGDTSTDGKTWTEQARHVDFESINEPFRFLVYAGWDTDDRVYFSSLNTDPYSSFENGYRYRKILTPNVEKVKGTNANYEFLVSHTDPDLKTIENGGKVYNQNLLDIRFEDSAGNKLAHEINKYDPATGEIIAWVYVSSFHAGTRIFMFYGKELQWKTADDEDIESWASTGIRVGYGDSDLTVTRNWNGAYNLGELYSYCTYIKDINGNTLELSNTNGENSISESGTNSKRGYLMYHTTASASRFTMASGNKRGNFIFVYQDSGVWYYDNNSTGVAFTPQITDILVARVRAGDSGGVVWATPLRAGEENPFSTWVGEQYAGAIYHLDTKPDGIAATHEHLDSSAGASHGSSYSAATSADSVAGKIGNAIRLDGVNDYILIADNLSMQQNLRITGSLTLSVWYYPRSHTQRYNIIGKAYGGEYELTQETNGNINFYWGTTGANSGTNGATPGYTSLNSNAAVNVNQWNHIVVTRTSGVGGAVNFWLNGVKTNSTTNIYANAVSSTNNVTLGSGRLSTYMPASLDEVRIISGAYSDDRVITEYNNQNDPSTFYYISEETIGSDTIYWVNNSGNYHDTALVIENYLPENIGTLGTHLYDGRMYGNTFMGNNRRLAYITINVAKYGSPTGYSYAKIYEHTGTYGVDGLPTGEPIAISLPKYVGSWTAGYVYDTSYTFIDSDCILLESNTAYVAVIQVAGGDSSNYIRIIDTDELGAKTNYLSGNSVYYDGSWSYNNTYDCHIAIMTRDIHFAYESGGEPYAYAESDRHVVFDENSFSLPGQVVNGYSLSWSVDWSKATNTPTWDVDGELINISGDFILNDDMSVVGEAELSLEGFEPGIVAHMGNHAFTLINLFGIYTYTSGINLKNSSNGFSTYLTIDAIPAPVLPWVFFNVNTSATYSNELIIIAGGPSEGISADISLLSSNNPSVVRFYEPSEIKIDQIDLAGTQENTSRLYGGGILQTYISSGLALSELNYMQIWDIYGVEGTTWTAQYSADRGNNTNIDFLNAAPGAEFTADISIGPQPLTVQFSDTSTGNPTSWLWDFGDGTTSTQQNPVHTYNDINIYTITLTVTNDYGETDITKADYIDVQVPTSFTANPVIGQIPLEVSFTDTTYPVPTDWTWDFGSGTITSELYSFESGTLDGLQTSGDANWAITQLHAASGTYSAKSGTITDNQSSTLSISDTFGIGATVSFNYKVSSESGYDFLEFFINGVNQLSVSGDSGWAASSEYAIPEGAATLEWVYEKDFSVSELDDAAYVDNIEIIYENTAVPNYEQNPTHTYTEPGEHTVTLQTSGPDGIGSANTTITALPPPPTAEFSADILEGLSPLTVTFTDESTDYPATWLWDFGDGETSQNQHPIHEYALAGIYTVKLTVTNVSGSDTEEKIDYITVVTLPTIETVELNSNSTSASYIGELTNSLAGTITARGVIVGTSPFMNEAQVPYNNLDLGIDYGIQDTNLKMQLDYWGGAYNIGEIYFTGTQFTRVGGTVVNIGTLNNGVAIVENLAQTRNAFIMYSATNVHTRFSANPPNVANATNLIGVYWDGTNWYYDNNTSLFQFTPVSTDLLIATVVYGLSTGITQASFIHASSETPDIGEFPVIISNLNPKTTYYAIPYATNSVGTNYGQEISFQTGSTSSADLNGKFNIMFGPA